MTDDKKPAICPACNYTWVPRRNGKSCPRCQKPHGFSFEPKPASYELGPIVCKKCGTPAGFHSRPGGTAIAVCSSCGGDETEIKSFHPKPASPTLNTETHIQGKPESPAREWQAREIYATWARHEHKDMPGSFVSKAAYDLVLEKAEAKINDLRFVSDTFKAERGQLRAEVERLNYVTEERDAALAENGRLKAECHEFHAADGEAIAKLVAEVERLKPLSLGTNALAELLRERDSLRAKLDKAVMGLKKIADRNAHGVMVSIARKTLKEIGEA